MKQELLSVVTAAAVMTCLSAQALGVSIDTVAIEERTGLKGTFYSAENVFKVTLPRTTPKVAVDGWSMPPFMGLSSWAAFTPMDDGRLMLMGDTVLFEDEVNPVMSVALDAGLDVTALHNHFFFDDPRVYFMHIAATGDAGTLASAVRRVYDKVGEIRAAHAQPQKAFPGPAIGATNSISAAPLEAILATKGQTKDGMFKVVIGRSASMHGTTVAKEMGVNTWAGFAGTDDEALVDGDFAMTERELQPVLKTMRRAGISVVAIHQHMTGEAPRILFLHFWGKGKAAALAQSLKGVLDAQASLESH